jgi:hypothetical protein
MNKLIKTSKVVKDATTNVRNGLDALERARDIYVATMKRAEVDFVDRMRTILTAIAGDEHAIVTPAPNGNTAPVTTAEQPMPPTA